MSADADDAVALKIGSAAALVDVLAALARAGRADELAKGSLSASLLHVHNLLIEAHAELTAVPGTMARTGRARH